MGTVGAGLARGDNAGGGLHSERMLDEYALLGLCPDGHVMELARPLLGPEVLNSDTVQGCRDGDVALVAGRVVRRQRPLAEAVFLTLEDEWGLIPIAVWEGRWERLKHALRRPLVVSVKIPNAPRQCDLRVAARITRLVVCLSGQADGNRAQHANRDTVLATLTGTAPNGSAGADTTHTSAASGCSLSASATHFVMVERARPPPRLRRRTATRASTRRGT